MWPKVNKADMTGMMESIKEYLGSCHGVVRVPLAHVFRKTVIVQPFGDSLKYTTSDNEMIARMLHLPPDKNRLHNEQSAQSVKGHKTEYEIDNRSV